MTVIGLISGTSYDAVDAAAARMRLEGDTLLLVPLGLHSVPVPAPLRARIAAALPPHRTTVEEICRLDTTIGQLFGSVAADANAALAGGGADLVSSHGQTVYHWVDCRTARGTLQLGEPAWIAEASGLPVVSGLRSRDITRGGQGAPPASLLDALLVLGDDRTAGSLNLGGIANITLRSDRGEIVAYDIGPASALMDSAVADATGGRERMDTLAAPAQVREFDDFGMSAQGKEAYTMAIIGFLTVHGLPATIPSATGAAASSILGSLTPGAAPLRLPAPAHSFPLRITTVAA